MKEVRFVLVVLAVFSISHFVTDGYINILSPLSPLILNDFQLSYTQLGLLISAFTLAASILQFVAGYLASRVGKDRLIMGGFIWTSVFIYGAALASSYPQLLVLLVAAGVGISFYHPSASSILSGTFPRRGRGRALSIYLFSGRVGAFSSVLLANVLASVVDWRLSLYTWAVSGLLVALIFAAVNLGDRVEPERKGSVITLGWQFSRRLSIVVLVLIYSVYEVLSRGLSTFIPIHLVESFGASVANAGFSVGLLMVCGSVGSVLIGFLSHRFDKERVVLLLVLLSVILTFFVAVQGMDLFFVFTLALLGVSVYSISPLTQALVSEYTLNSERTKVFGFLFTVSNGLGAVTPLLMGVIADAYSLQASFYLLIAVACAGVASMLGLVLMKS
ncbi:hypothetical protein DRO42_07475 [Candidatus Bathyarchaeota archaeon]|nr:MAG: hypothetical protein DRO42_07475 [Candidatus Bathyarchaeota archaeon]